MKVCNYTRHIIKPPSNYWHVYPGMVLLAVDCGKCSDSRHAKYKKQATVEDSVLSETSISHTPWWPLPQLKGHHRGGGGREVIKVRGRGSYYEILSSGYDTADALMNSLQLGLLAPKLPKIGAITILPWKGERILRPHQSLRGYWQLILTSEKRVLSSLM